MVHCAAISSPQVQIFNPAFFKYIHDRWTRHHGCYPSTGMLVLFFALHVCDEVRTSLTHFHTNTQYRHVSQPVSLPVLKRYLIFQVNVFGFGADSRGNWHHYWEQNRYSGEFRKTGVHDADYEALVIDSLVKAGKITIFPGK